METLEKLCQMRLITYLLRILQEKKRQLGCWVIGLSEWVTRMELGELRRWLELLPPPVLHDLLQEGLEALLDARNRDLLLCLVTLGLGEKTTKLHLPPCLRMDEGSRFYLLGLLENVPRLQVLLCCCYRGGTLYVSDKEIELLSVAVQNMRKLQHLEVRGVANNALVQAVAKGCPSLRVLDFSESAFDDKMARILTGQSQIQVRGPLVREVNIKGGQAACKESLVLLDLRRTQLSFSGASQLRGAFPCMTTLLL